MTTAGILVTAPLNESDTTMDTIDSTTITDPTNTSLTFHVRVVPDTESRPGDADVYGDHATMTAWRNDEWSFVGVIVTPVVAGVEYDEQSTSLWGVEYGAFPITDEHGMVLETRYIGIDEIATVHPGPDLITEAREAIVSAASNLAANLSGLEVEPTATADTDDFSYERRQIDRVIADGPDHETGGAYHLKIWGASTETKTLSITPEQLTRIREVLAS